MWLPTTRLVTRYRGPAELADFQQRMEESVHVIMKLTTDSDTTNTNLADNWTYWVTGIGTPVSDTAETVEVDEVAFTFQSLWNATGTGMWNRMVKSGERMRHLREQL